MFNALLNVYLLGMIFSGVIAMYGFYYAKKADALSSGEQSEIKRLFSDVLWAIGYAAVLVLWPLFMISVIAEMICIKEKAK